MPAATTIERLHGSLRSETSVLSISPTPFIRPSPRHQSTQTVETNMLFSGADPVRSRLSCRINFRRNNGRGQKLSGRSFIEQDATGRARYFCNERVCIVNKNNNLMRKTASYIFSPSSLYGLRRAMLRNASMRNGMR